MPLTGAACHVCIRRGLCKEHMVEMAVKVLKELAKSNLVSDSITYRKLIKAQFIEGNCEGVLKFIHTIAKIELELFTSIATMC